MYGKKLAKLTVLLQLKKKYISQMSYNLSQISKRFNNAAH